MKSFNVKFPLRDDPSTNTYFQMTQITKDALSSDLLLLLLTLPGERYYFPEYGSNLLKYIFEPNDNLTSTDVEQEIKRLVSLYIPSLTIDKVNFNWSEDSEGNAISDNQLNVDIRFTYSEENFSEQGNLVLNF